ncbi:HpcH/HpaI aldolase/citrate lyase family protein [Nocardioides sp. AX2bis]|uniref:HpcH/HpaI aldolase/citrate lyase family protein n=1 Tax=Nocardioides sp. AX2bis TaxID=2653157 RepID=UPI0012EF1BF1|nr:CoA ester lyase [Nocardioides sp. AX2bis]VXC36247.1 Citrate lyase beta chain [Nocardioides sp. AX2bis]
MAPLIAATVGAETARSWLFVPATRPERFSKAAASGADMVVVDLEDAVPPGEKAAARSEAGAWLAGEGAGAVRVNPADSPHHADDLAALAGLRGLRAVLVPMADSVDALARVHRQLGPDVAVVAQVETALGLVRAVDLASAPGVVRLAFGHLDFAFDVDAAPEPEAMAYARSTLVVASRAAGVAGPVDSVTTDLDDARATQRDAARARAFGFTGKLCIHPHQVAAVNEAMSPTDAQVAWAGRVLAAGPGAVRVDGQMVDAPVVARAERILERSRSSR